MPHTDRHTRDDCNHTTRQNQVAHRRTPIDRPRRSASGVPCGRNGKPARHQRRRNDRHQDDGLSKPSIDLGRLGRPVTVAPIPTDLLELGLRIDERTFGEIEIGNKHTHHCATEPCHKHSRQPEDPANPLTGISRLELIHAENTTHNSSGPNIGFHLRNRVKRTVALLISGSAGLTILAFWWFFASSDSSTASFIFLLGRVPGIPMATVATGLAISK
ncbi:MAG: hypothetical protein AAGE88_17875 [Actinomycetota bacterium]